MDIRMVTATLLAPVLALTGYRFDKSWRWADRGAKALTYRYVSTVVANIKADRLARVQS